MEIKHLRPGDDLTDALWVRDEVFTKEQGFANPDLDNLDAMAHHIVLYMDAHPIATGRIFSAPTSGEFTLGRIAVLKSWRGHQLGRTIIDELERIATAIGAQTLTLGAQLYAVPFYQKCGFTPTGERYMDEFCEHEKMYKSLR